MSLYSDKGYTTSFRSLDGWKNPRPRLRFSLRHLEGERRAIILSEYKDIKLKFYNLMNSAPLCERHNNKNKHSEKNLHNLLKLP